MARLLTRNRGALVPWKSFWHWIDFEWKEGKWSYAKTRESDFDFKMTDTDGNEASIKLVPHDEGRKTLGTYIAPSGSWDMAITKMLEKVNNRMTTAWKVQVERKDMWLGTEMTLKKRLSIH